MIIQVTLENDKLNRIRNEFRTSAAHERLNHAAAYALRAQVKSWIRHFSGWHHKTAHALGAAPTGHLEDAAATVTAESSAESARVVIPSPGFGRVFHPITVRPVQARALTIPISAHSYGTTVGEMQANGWKIFHPKGTRVLMGEGPGEDAEAEPLFALSASARIPQDRSLLPSDQQMHDVCANAMRLVINRILKGRGK